MTIANLVRSSLALAASLLLALIPVTHGAEPKSKAATTGSKSSGAKAAGSRSSAAKSAAKSEKPAGKARDPYLGAIVIEASSGRVLFEDNADTAGYPASVLKLMDLLIILDRVEAGQLSLKDTVPVSARASKTGGSQVWLAEKETFTVDDLLYALMVQSANDAAVALAEKVAGSTEAFVQLMNDRARALGMSHTTFHSVHGLPPSAGQQFDVTTARDFAILCREVLRRRDVLRYTSTRERPFRPDVAGKTVVMRTHNHLLGQVDGCDGLKTGYIAAAGFSIAATAERQGRRVIAVVLDSADRKTRDAKAAELINRGFTALTAAPSSPAAPAAQTRPLPAPAR